MKMKKKLYDTVSDFDENSIALYGWNLDKKRIIEKIENELEEKIEIISISEMGYYTTLYDGNGENAKDYGYNFWVWFVEKPEMKKTYGKCTCIYYRIVPDEELDCFSCDIEK